MTPSLRLLWQTLVRRGPDASSLVPVRGANGTVTGVMLTYTGNEQVTFSRTCARMLEYPQRMYVRILHFDETSAQLAGRNSLDNSRREDLALIGSQFWLLGISTFGVRTHVSPMRHCLITT